MNDTEKHKLRELLLEAIAAYKNLELAKEKLEAARAAFGYAKLYKNEPRLINIDGILWGVTVPFPRNPDDYEDDKFKGSIIFDILGDFV